MTGATIEQRTHAQFDGSRTQIARCVPARSEGEIDIRGAYLRSVLCARAGRGPNATESRIRPATPRIVSDRPRRARLSDRLAGTRVSERQTGMALIGTSLERAPLRGDPRFRVLLSRMHLPEQNDVDTARGTDDRSVGIGPRAIRTWLSHPAHVNCSAPDSPRPVNFPTATMAPDAVLAAPHAPG